MKRVLIATDGSDHALKAAELAGELAAKLGAELHVLAVFCHDRSGEQELREFGRIEHLEDGLASILRANVEQARRVAETKGAKAVETAVVEGDPAEEIIKYVKENDIEGVVVGRRGKGILERLLLGSVSQKLASLVPCVVIISP